MERGPVESKDGRCNQRALGVEPFMGHYREALASDRLGQSRDSAISKSPGKSAVKLIMRAPKDSLTATKQGRLLPLREFETFRIATLPIFESFR
jgi:hypothetical protein